VMKTVQAAQREVSNRVTASLAAQFGDQDTMDLITQFMPKPEAEPTRPERDPDDLGGEVLRKRPGGPTAPAPHPPRRRPDDDGPGSLLR